MPIPEAAAEPTAIDLARECLYRFLAATLSDPRTVNFRLALDPDNQVLVRAAAELLRTEAEAKPAALGFGELPSKYLELAPLLRALQQPALDLVTEYDRVFGLVLSRECPPYETEYHPPSETFFRSQQLADIAGFHRAFGLETSASSPERPDHVALELEFMSFLLLKKRLAHDSATEDPGASEQSSICDDALRAFFRDHLAWWLPTFATGLRGKAGTGLYEAVGQVLAAFLPVERSRLDVEPPRFPLQPALIERPEEQADCAECTVQTER